ncbi:MAG TPA: 4Fe-4S dicluster domain-containing protein [Armatimonadota bacterium]|jgi:ferredoxin
MSTDTNAVHYVCTYEEARALLAAQREFNVRTCGCRTKHPGAHADNDCCLWFTDANPEVNGQGRPITAEAAATLLERARTTGLIIRPFRDFETQTETIGICSCCGCCCSYFHDTPREECDKGACIEQTAADACTLCGLCVSACLFQARAIIDGALQINGDNCFGCGICADTCPTNAVRMIRREMPG